MRLPIVYANTAVRVLEIAGANVASLIFIITSSVVIELDLIFLTALRKQIERREKEDWLPLPSPPSPTLPISTISRVFFFFSFFIISWNIFTVLLFPIFVTASRKLVPPYLRSCYRFFQPASFGHLESKLIRWLFERMFDLIEIWKYYYFKLFKTWYSNSSFENLNLKRKKKYKYSSIQQEKQENSAIN